MSRNQISRKLEGVYQKSVEQCAFKRSTGCRREFKSPREHDVRAHDGIVSYGQRTVSKEGSIRFGGITWQHDDLKPLAGFIIGVCMGDYWMSYIDIWWPAYPGGEWMLRIDAYDPGKTA